LPRSWRSKGIRFAQRSSAMFCAGWAIACRRIARPGKAANTSALGTTAQLWLNLQTDYDVEVAKRDLGKILDRIETVNKPNAA
jgi:hypothetical protein